MQYRTLGVVCDCQTASILEALPLSPTELEVAATCNDQPTILLSSDGEAPCSPVRVADVVNVTAASALVSWTYPNRTEFDKVEHTFSFASFVGDFVETALAQFIQLNTSIIVPEDAAKEFEQCGTIFLKGTVDSSAWGFEFVWTNQQTGKVNKRCDFASGPTINRLGPSGTGENFDSTIDVEPGETYSVRLRPIVVKFSSNKLMGYNFGPLSNVKTFVAKEAAPGGPVRELSVQSREDDRIVLLWLEPLKRNGLIIRYVIIVNDGQNPSLNSTSEAVVPGEPARATTTLKDLNPSVKYDITVFAETTIGAGPVANITVETCPQNMRSLADDPNSCVAKRGFFLGKDTTKPISCSIFAGLINLADCLEDDLRVGDLKLASGFWRPAIDSVDIRVCPLGETACSGGQNLSLCKPNYGGALCAVCADGFFYNGEECDVCESPNFVGFAPLIAALCVTFCVATGSYIFIKRNFDQISRAGSVALKFKVLISTYQIVATFSWTLGTAFPSVYTQILGVLQFFSFDVTELFPVVDCLYRSNYLVKLLIVTCLPLLLVVLPTLAYWRRKVVRSDDAAEREKVKTRSLQVLIVATFLVYTPVASKIFRALRPCNVFPDIGQAFMPEDYQIACDSADYSLILVVAYTMMVIYCFGIPAFYIVLLWPRRKDIQEQCKLAALGENRTVKEEQRMNELSDKLQVVSFLFQSYWYWWWEIVEAIRKVLLAGIITLIAPGTAEQSIVLMILALGSSVLYHHFLPLRDENLLGLVASYTVFFAAFASLLVKVGDEFLNSEVLDILLVAVVSSPLVFGLVISEQFLGSVRKRCGSRKARAFSEFIVQEFGRSSANVLHERERDLDPVEDTMPNVPQPIRKMRA